MFFELVMFEDCQSKDYSITVQGIPGLMTLWVRVTVSNGDPWRLRPPLP